MSHHTQDFLTAPRSLVITQNKNKIVDYVQLIVKGQGVVGFKLKKGSPYELEVRNPEETNEGITALKLSAEKNIVTFSKEENGKWSELSSVKSDGIGIDEDPDCTYWLSIDYHNRFLRYGKGEVRLNTCLAEANLGKMPEGDKKDPYEWLNYVTKVFIDHNIVDPVKVWRDPVVIDPAIIVISTEEITMDDIALNNGTVPANLTPACQQLYANVSGSNFQLDTSDFPHFVDAVEASIRSPKGWCYQMLQHKLEEEEFGPDTDPHENYLRITMGVNQGDSPGIPYVMEIWPPGNYSPIHNHARANAIIRVLSGEINVSLYPMLSKYHETPFMNATFRKDQVTWISPELNQTHKLHNLNKSGPTCITIQCYMYSDGNTEHYEYFDFIDEQGSIHQFTPNSDMGFVDFKAQMKYEWDNGITR